MKFDWKEKTKENLEKAEQALAKAKEVIDDPDALYKAAYELYEITEDVWVNAICNQVEANEK